MRILKTFVYLTVLAAFCVAPALAGQPFTPKTEWTLSGSAVNQKDGPTLWELGTDLLFPIAWKGTLLLGPEVIVNKDSAQTRLGPVVEVNIPGGQKGGFFFGAALDYFVKDSEGLDRTTTAARAGIKLPIASSGLVKLYAEKPVSGRGKEEAELTAVLALAVKF